MNLPKIPMAILEQYRRNVRGNEAITMESLQIKLYRNMQLAATSKSHTGRGTFYMYGRLHFLVDGANTVQWMGNRMPIPEGWKRDDELYLKLNKELGIDSDITATGLMVRDVYLSVPRDGNGIKWKIGNKVVVG